MQIPKWISKKDVGIHIIVGTILVLLIPSWALPVSLGIGGCHEYMDGDLLVASGHPWNGLIDMAAFALVPFVYWLLH